MAEYQMVVLTGLLCLVQLVGQCTPREALVRLRSGRFDQGKSVRGG